MKPGTLYKITRGFYFSDDPKILGGKKLINDILVNADSVLLLLEIIKLESGTTVYVFLCDNMKIYWHQMYINMYSNAFYELSDR
jgi:hypothetical protein